MTEHWTPEEATLMRSRLIREVGLIYLECETRPNTKDNRLVLLGKVNAFMDKLESHQALISHVSVCDDSNNPPDALSEKTPRLLVSYVRSDCPFEVFRLRLSEDNLEGLHILCKDEND